MGLDSKIAGKEYFPQYGELNLDIADRVYRQLFGTELISEHEGGARGKLDAAPIPASDNNLGELLSDIPQRPPVLCAGCPHRSVFYILKKLKSCGHGRYRLLYAFSSSAAECN